MELQIEEYYDKLNYPSATVIYKAMKKDNIPVTLKAIESYLNKQESEQVTKQIKIKHDGHITASYQNEFWQMDIYDLSKYESQNKHYKYILCCIDVFTRKAFCIAMKTKSESDVINALTIIITDNSVIPTVIISDSDSSFLSKSFVNFLKKHEIVQNTVPIGDHASLGIVDRFALTLKRILTKYFLKFKTTNWTGILSKVINNYNNKPHKGILDLTPNEATLENNREVLFELNTKKSKHNNIVSDLNEGDKVRINTKKIFKKGSEPIWSNQVYEVKSARGKTILLTDGQKKARSMLLKVHKDTLNNTESNVIDKANKARRIKRRLNTAGMVESDIVVEKRNRKKKVIYDV